MRTDYPVILDACVLARGRVCDLYLRLAEPPRLYLPRWSPAILDEVRRTQIEKLDPAFTPAQADYWRQQVTRAFPEASVEHYSQHLPSLTNHPKDRHVLAAAIESGSRLIVTYNLRDFPAVSLTPFSIEAVHPQDYLLTLYSMTPAIVMAKLAAMAERRQLHLEDLLIQLGRSVPAFAAQVLKDMGRPA